MFVALLPAALPSGQAETGELLPRGWSFPDSAASLSRSRSISLHADSVHPPYHAMNRACSAAGGLSQIYDGLGSQLRTHGLLRSEIEEGTNSDFSVHANGTKYPRFYDEEPWCMRGNGPVRPIAMRISDVGDLKRSVLGFVDEVVDALGPKVVVQRQAPEALHATIFHPDTFYAWRRKQVGLANESQTPEQKLPMTKAALDDEHTLIREVAAKQPHFITLEVDSVVTTSGGVMLMLLRPPSERQCEDPSQTDLLRKQFADVFPHGSAPSRILHVSLMRILDLPEAQLKAKADAVRIVCEKATEKLQGYRFNITRLLFVHEMQILTLKGSWHWFPLGVGPESQAEDHSS